MRKSVLAVEIGAGSIKMLYGYNNRVLAYQMVETPIDSVDDNKILRVDLIASQISCFIKSHRLFPNSISFSIYGQDLVIRHMEIPYMKESEVRQSVEWEIGQNLHDGGTNYYIDMEILNRKEGKKEKFYQILAVAVLKEKIDTYIELAKVLNLEVKAIDISFNCMARVFRHLTVGNKAKKNIGIIDIGLNNTEIAIVEAGKLAIERQVPFGMDKIFKEIRKSQEGFITKEFDYIRNQFSFNDEQFDVELRISRLLDNLFTSLQKVIQFYTTGKIEKEISQFYLIGVGSEIKGIEDIVHEYLSGQPTIVKETSMIGQKIKLPKDCELKYFVNTLGLLLRED